MDRVRLYMSQGRELLLGVALVASSVTHLGAQQTGARDGHTLLAPGPRYRAGGLHRLLLGREYRALWTTPVSVPVLDLRTFAGGLVPVSSGGGQQTRSLLLRSRDGHEFFFRSVDKDPSATLPPELRPTVAGQVVRDQTSSAFPTAPLVTGPLLRAAGILHGESHFYALPRDVSLGEFEGEFGGMIGFLQERIGGSAGPAARWGGAAEIIGSDTLLARITRGPEDRVDTRAFLSARLFDLLIGDWDRHAGQWRWARFGDAVPHRWVPIPEDRDQAFVKYDGVLLSVARQTAPQLTNFGPSYPYLPGATWNGRDLDRRLLVELEWPEWESAAVRLQGALTDDVIDKAVRALPAEHYALRGHMLVSSLRARRDKLLEAARGYYELLAKQVDVHAGDGDDRAEIVRQADGVLELTISRGADTNDHYFRRRFDRQTTSEVRVFLGRGDDQASVRGSRDGPLLRILGGAGQDELVDSTRGGNEQFYDDQGSPDRTAGFANKVDRRPYTAPGNDPKAVPPRDWGKRWTASTWATLGPDIGLLIGGGRTLTVYGFRKHPYASRHRFRAGFATGPRTYRLDYRGEFRRENSTGLAELLVRASGVDVISFHGFGNETSAPGNNEFYRVTQDVFSVQPAFVLPVGSRASVRLGPILKYASTDPRPGRFLATLGDQYGTGSFGELGAGVALQFDSRNQPHGATRGMTFELGAKAYPAFWHVDSTFGEVHGEITTYLTPPIPFEPTLALRAGGRKLWGHYPFFEAAFIGGPSTVRLGRVNRYAGDAAAYGNAEIRLALARVTLVLPADLGVFGLADAGRVFLNGESSDEWHTAFGGGIWLSFMSRANTLSAAVAAGDETTGLYVQAGFGF
jgi:hypothetical protein